MVDELIRNQRKHFNVHYSSILKNFPDFYVKNNLRKMLTICNQTAYRKPLLATESVAKVNRFSESARKNAPNFPK